MILEDKTFKEFGYYSYELAPKSDKRILVACDGCGIIRKLQKKQCRDFCRACACKSIAFREKLSKVRKGTHASNVTKKKMSDMRKGEKHHFYGKHLSEDHRKKLSEAHKGIRLSEVTKKRMSEARKGNKNHNFGKTFTKEHRQRLSTSQKELLKNNPIARERLQKMREQQSGKKTKPEKIFIEICKRNNLDFHYVGDGSLWIGKKERRQLNPDFIEANGKKIIVEVFGDYWHSPLLNRGMKEYATREYRKRHYKQFGWKSIFLWESDLLRKDADTFILMELEKGGVM